MRRYINIQRRDTYRIVCVCVRNGVYTSARPLLISMNTTRISNEPVLPAPKEEVSQHSGSRNRPLTVGINVKVSVDVFQKLHRDPRRSPDIGN